MAGALGPTIISCATDETLRTRAKGPQLMDTSKSEDNEPQLTLRPVDRDNWRGVAKLEVTAAQREFVSEPCRYLALCSYGGDWKPLAVCLGDQVIGFLMWVVDPADGSCWLGGIIIDQKYQCY